MEIKEAFTTDPFSWWLPYIFAIMVGVITIIREYCGGIECPSKNFVLNKVILITGGTGTIAYECILELVKRGGTIILTCRNQQKGEATKQKVLSLVPKATILVKQLDISSISEIKKFVCEKLFLEYRKIDILINLAGIQNYKFEMTEEGFEQHCATNYLGHFYLCHLVLPHMSSSNGSKARIINVTDGVYKNLELDLTNFNMTSNWDCRTAYSQSKLCVALMTGHMAKIFEENKITVNAVIPGRVRGTNLIQNSAFHALLKVWSYPLLWIFYKTPKQGAQSIIFASVDSKLEKTTGKVISNCEIQSLGLAARNGKLCEKLYLKTCELINIVPIIKR